MLGRGNTKGYNMYLFYVEVIGTDEWDLIELDTPSSSSIPYKWTYIKRLNSWTSPY